MKQLTAEQLEANWYKLRDLITESFEGERLEKLNEMYDYFEDRMVMAPASGKEHYHNAFVGGYVDHVLHVTDLALKINKNVYQVTCEQELNPEWFVNKESIGISAGASTPDHLIKEVKSKIEKIYEVIS